MPADSDQTNTATPDVAQKQGKILIVDDEQPIRRLLSRILKMSDYECTTAGDASEGRQCLQEETFDLVMSDVKMPGESGIDLIRHVIEAYPDTAVVMATAMDDPQYAETALEIGAYAYIIKPFKTNEVIITVANALRRRRLEIENRTHRENLELLVSERTDKLQETLQKLSKTMEGIIQAMALTIETRDPYTAGHQRRVADLACAIAEEMELDADRIYGIKMAGEIHDLGKISIPAEILSKPTRLTEIEFMLIKTHPEAGYEILKGIEFPWPVADMVVQHHEKMNGSGYPNGLTGEELITESKILTVADVVEAMASHRPYRAALGIDIALEEIEKNKTTLYDTVAAEACIELFRKREYQIE